MPGSGGDLSGLWSNFTLRGFKMTTEAMYNGSEVNSSIFATKEGYSPRGVPEGKAVVLVDREELERFRSLSLDVSIQTATLSALSVLCDCALESSIGELRFNTVLHGLSQALQRNIDCFNTLSGDLCEVYNGMKEVHETAECPE